MNNSTGWHIKYTLDGFNTSSNASTHVEIYLPRIYSLQNGMIPGVCLDASGGVTNLQTTVEIFR